MWILSSRLIPHDPFKLFHFSKLNILLEHSSGTFSGTFFRCTAFEAYSAEHSSPSSLRAPQITAVGVFPTTVYYTAESTYLLYNKHRSVRFPFFIFIFLFLFFYFLFFVLYLAFKIFSIISFCESDTHTYIINPKYNID